MAVKYKDGVQSALYFNMSVGAPIDSRFVVDSYSDLTSGAIKALYTGLLVYAVDVESFYVFTATEKLALNAKKEEYWKKIGGKEIFEGEVVIDRVPESGNGISINRTDNVLREYVSSDNTITSDKFYTSLGLNTFEDGEKGDEYIVLSNGGDSYIKLFNGEDGNWIEMHIVDDSLGFTLDDVKVKGDDGEVTNYVNDTQIPNETQITFGSEIDFTGFTETKPDGTVCTFGEDGSSYEDVDIYNEIPVMDVTIYNNGDTINVLTDLDKSEIDDKFAKLEEKIDNIYDTLMIDPDGEGEKDPATLREVIENMNNAISTLENIKDADESDIDSIFDSETEEDGESETEKSPIIQVKSLKYFRDRLLEEIPYSVEDGKPMVKIGDKKKELATADMLMWVDEID